MNYPERPKLFALHYIKWLADSYIVQEVGPDAFAVLVAVVTKEDDLHYQRPVNFYNGQLSERCGIVSVHALIRARTKAVEAGLLEYEPAAKRRPGRYFVCGFHAQSAGKAEGIPKESGRNPQPSIPNPNPNPNTSTLSCASEADADQELSQWIEFWNALKADGLVKAGTATKPSTGVIAGWKRFKRSAEVRELLSDKEAIRKAIEKSEFVRKSWFTLGKLLGGKNPEGEYIAQRLFDGCYTESNPQKPRSANIGPGVNYNPNEDLKW